MLAAIALSIALAVVLGLCSLRTYRVPSGSMLPTIPCGSHIVATRLPRALQHVHVGEVWVLRPPAGIDQSGRVDVDVVRGEDHIGLFARRPVTPARRGLHPAHQTYVKRIVAVGGDTIAVHDGQTIRNGTPLDEPYRHGEAPLIARSNRLMQMPRYRLPSGWVFALGDWRGNSADSRFWGPVPESFLVARVRGISWPFHAIGPLRSDGSADRGTHSADERKCVDVTTGT